MAAASLIVLLAACGGGGGKNSGASSNNGGIAGGSPDRQQLEQSPSIDGMRWTIAPLYTGLRSIPQWQNVFNDEGQFLGEDYICGPGVTRPDGCERPFLTDASGAVNYLGEEWYKSAPRAINNAGQILAGGTFRDPQTGAEKGGTFVYGRNQYIEVPAYSTILNDAGTVAGYELTSVAEGSAGLANRAFVYKDGTRTQVNPLPGHSDTEAMALNASGALVGKSLRRGDSYEERAFLYSGGAIRNLGVLPGYAHSYAVDINRSGQVAGSSVVYEEGNLANVVRSQPFIYTNGVMKPIPNNADNGRVAQAESINDSGQVVGYSYIPGVENSAAGFIYSGGKTVDLNTLADVVDSGWKIGYARNINNKGQIIGEGMIDGAWRTFILSPAPAN